MIGCEEKPSSDFELAESFNRSSDRTRLLLPKFNGKQFQENKGECKCPR